ncbi:MAG: CHASE2 domain-containing protein [FCB group bacterium]|jgi:CHASE2 domain-containing sensor protein
MKKIKFIGNSKFINKVKDYLYPSRWSKKKQIHFIINIAIGLIIAVLMNVLEHEPVGRTILNYMVDKLIRKEFSQSSNKIPNNLIFIDIDSQVEDIWNNNDSTSSSLMTNRTKLAQLLEAIEQSRPKVIVLDIDFSLRNSQKGNDDLLIAFFQNFKTKAINKQTSTHIVLPVEIKQDNTLRLSFMDSLFKSNPNVCSASAYVATELNDRTIRYVVDYKITNPNDTIWSVPLAAFALYNDLNKGNFSKERLEKQLHLNIENEGNEKKFSLNIFASRIRYKLQPPAISDKEKKELSGNLNGNNQQKANIRFSPYEFTGLTEPDDFLSQKQKDSILSGKIVIIGNSSLAKGDFHLTPIGEMAGMYVIGNGINTLFMGQINELSVIWVIVIELLIIFFAAYLFLHLHSTAAEIIGLILMGVPLYFLTIYIFDVKGTVINVIFTMLGIAAHRVVSGLEDMLSAKGRKQHSHNIN